MVQHSQINVMHINKRKDKNYIIILIDTEKNMTKFNIHSQFLKSLIKVVIGRTYLNMMKAIYEKHSKYHIQWRKVESFPIKFKDKIRMPTLTTSI